MANVDAPQGFGTLERTITGGPPVTGNFQKDVSEGTAIFTGDIVELEADAKIAPGGTPSTTLFLGVALNFGAATTLTDHVVIISPGALYRIQDNGGAGVALIDIGFLADVELNAGSDGVSGHELNVSTLAVTATLDLKILELIKSPDNAFGANAQVMVLINKHFYNQNVVGI